MEKFIIEHPAFVYLVFLSLAGLLGILIKHFFTNYLSELKIVKSKQNEIVENYITRFDNVDEEFKKVRIQANDHKLEIVGTLTEMKVDIQSVFDAIGTQTKICALIQEQKKQ